VSPKAIAQAEDRFAKAERAVERLRIAKSFSEAEGAWSDFLAAASTIYSKLEQGSKTNGRSTAWFGRAKKVRKDDPLLRYLHHARNSDEHSIADITERKPGSWGITGDVILNGTIGGPGSVLNVTGTNPARPPRVFVKPSRLELIRVTDDRYGDAFDPPAEHLGKPIEDNTPLPVAELGLAYLKAMIEEARRLAP